MADNKEIAVSYYYRFATGTSDCDDYQFSTFDEFLDNIERIDTYSDCLCSTEIAVSRNGVFVSLGADTWRELAKIIKEDKNVNGNGDRKRD